MRYTGTGIIVEKYKGNALFYKLKTKLSLETIQAVFTSAPELQKDIPDHWETESHWLADWNLSSLELFDNMAEGVEIEVSFEVKSTTYNRNMKHGDKFIGPCSNVNVTTVKKR